MDQTFAKFVENYPLCVLIIIIALEIALALVVVCLLWVLYRMIIIATALHCWIVLTLWAHLQSTGRLSLFWNDGVSMLPAKPIWSIEIMESLDGSIFDRNIKSSKTLQKEKLIMVKQKVKVGDIVSYKNRYDTYTYHRITAIKRLKSHRHKKWEWWVRCKGDNNRYHDSWIKLETLKHRYYLRLTPRWFAWIYKYCVLYPRYFRLKRSVQCCFNFHGLDCDNIEHYSYPHAFSCPTCDNDYC